MLKYDDSGKYIMIYEDDELIAKYCKETDNFKIYKILSCDVLYEIIWVIKEGV